MGRVSLGGGQIVIEGIHVTASITNDGTPSYKAAVSVASATIGGVPVTIDQDGVHVTGQGQGLPYQQASDALNSALKQAGIQLFLVGPEVTTCGQSGTGTSGGGDSGTSTTTTTSSSDQSSSCDQSGGGSSMCDQSGTGSDSGGSSGTTPCPACRRPRPTSPARQPHRSRATSRRSCDQARHGDRNRHDLHDCGDAARRRELVAHDDDHDDDDTSRSPARTRHEHDEHDVELVRRARLLQARVVVRRAGHQHRHDDDPNDQAGTTTTMGSGDSFGLGGGTSNAGEMTVTATGVHVVFTQPVSPPGVPAQYVEHILGEVFVDSLATPASDAPGLGFGSSSSSSSLPVLLVLVVLRWETRAARRRGASASGGGTSASGSAADGLLRRLRVGLRLGVHSSGSTGTSLPAAFAAALRKPLWLLLAYLRVAGARDRHRSGACGTGVERRERAVSSVGRLLPRPRARTDGYAFCPDGRLLVPSLLHRGQVPALR